MAGLTRRDFLNGACASVLAGLFPASVFAEGSREKYALNNSALENIDFSENFAKVILDIERSHVDVPDDAYRRLELILGASEKSVKIDDIPVERMYSIHDLLSGEFGYSYKETAYLSEALTAQDSEYFFDCDTSAHLYVGIAEHLSIKGINEVRTPNHMFLSVGCEDGCDSYFFWDTSEGFFFSAKHVDFPGLSEDNIKSGACLRPLDRYEAFSMPLALAGWKIFQQGRKDEGVGFAKKAVEFDIKNPVSHAFYGVLLNNMGEESLAQEHLRMTRVLDPAYSPSPEGLSLIRFRKNRLD